MSDTPDLETAYGLDGPEGSRQLYAKWAQTYDTSFAAEMDYLAPQEVAACYANLSGAGPVLDLGAGTGLVGEALARMGVGPVDATDISPEMLQQAQAKTVYRRLFEGDLTTRLDVPDGHYAGAVSSGTFTHGHVGPEAIGEILRCIRSGGWAVVSVNTEHWSALGFQSALDRLAPQIAQMQRAEFRLYGEGATGAHANDTSLMVQLRKA